MGESRLREFEEMVLLAVLVAGADAYGVSLQQILAEQAGRDVSLGAIYTALDRLTRKGLVRSELGAPTPVRGGRRRRHYRLTPTGLRELRAVRNIREGMWEQVAPDLTPGGTER